MPAMHVRGVVLPDEQQRDLWIVDDRISTTPVPDATSIGTGFVLPGLVDAHCHIGLGFDGPVEDAAGQEEQAIQDRDAGALLVRDCGSPVDTGPTSATCLRSVSSWSPMVFPLIRSSTGYICRQITPDYRCRQVSCTGRAGEGFGGSRTSPSGSGTALSCSGTALSHSGIYPSR